MKLLIERLLNAFGVSGHESEIRNIIRDELKDAAAEIREDKMGNLIVKVGAGLEKWMFCAHMDQIGLIATYIEENGFVRVGSIGELKTEDIAHNFVRFENGVLGKIGSGKDNPEIGDLFIDLGVKSREEALKKVKEANVAAFSHGNMEIENQIIGPNLDNRLGCYALIQLIKEVKDVNKEIYFVFSTQSELGGRGARAAAYAIEPDYCVVIDVQEAGDVIGGEGNIKLGEGPVLRVMDRTLIMHHEIKERIEKASEKANIKVQYASGGLATDGATIHKEKNGVKTGVLAIPCRYVHSVSEMAALQDVEDLIVLLKVLITA